MGHAVGIKGDESATSSAPAANVGYQMYGGCWDQRRCHEAVSSKVRATGVACWLYLFYGPLIKFAGRSQSLRREVMSARPGSLGLFVGSRMIRPKLLYDRRGNLILIYRPNLAGEVGEGTPTTFAGAEGFVKRDGDQRVLAVTKLGRRRGPDRQA